MSILYKYTDGHHEWLDDTMQPYLHPTALPVPISRDPSLVATMLRQPTTFFDNTDAFWTDRLVRNQSNGSRPRCATEAPLLPAPPPRELSMDDNYIFNSYLLYVRHTQCQCGAKHTQSEIFEVFAHRTKTADTSLRRTRPLAGKMQGGFELGVSHSPVKHLPVCHSCVATLSGFDAPTPVPRPDLQAWAETLRRKAQAARQPTSQPATRKQPLTLEDL